MYKINRIGPWPIIDINASPIIRTTGAAQTAIGSSLDVCMDTANLGSMSEAFVAGQYNALTSIAAENSVSFGVALTPLTTDEPVYVDISMAAFSKIAPASASTTEVMDCVPFIGYCDGTPQNGWGSAGSNDVTNWSLIPPFTEGMSMAINTQVLLKDIVYGGVQTGYFVCVGFTIQNGNASSAHSFDNLNYMISARYATKALSTKWEGAY